MKDSFGVEMAIGDRILSASTSGARVKIGVLFDGKNGPLMTIEQSAVWGTLELRHNKTGVIGYNVVVLQKADGTVPAHMRGVYPELMDELNAGGDEDE